jgi:hypothetical protein
VAHFLRHRSSLRRLVARPIGSRVFYGKSPICNPRLRRPIWAIIPEYHALPYPAPVTRVKARFCGFCLPCFTLHLQPGSPQNPPTVFTIGSAHKYCDFKRVVASRQYGTRRCSQVEFGSAA